MSLTFPRVPLVAPGDPIQAADLVALANAINARIRSGLGDWAWRMAYYWFCGARQIRNPDEAGLRYPTQAEYFEFYQAVPPEKGYTWPLTGPGEPEGVNLASLLGGYVFGVGDVAEESDRIEEPEYGGMPTGRPRNAVEAWVLGQSQRGAYDPVTGVAITPAFSAARSFFNLTQGPYSPHGNSYGGFLPMPQSLGTCGDGTETTPPSDNLEVFFSPIRPGLSTVVFPGTCPNNDGHVARVVTFPEYYLVLRYNAPPVRLSTADYIEGPYSGGGRLRKTWGRHLERVLNWHGKEFRGTPSQRAEEDAGERDWASSGFDHARFFESQYLLAPAVGRQEGDYVVADYPLFRHKLALRLPARTTLGSQAIRPGNVGAAALVFCAYLAGAADVEILDDGRVAARVTLSPEGPFGTASRIVVFDPPLRGSVSVRLVTGARFTQADSGSGIAVELAELLDYKPKHHDWAMYVRASGARVELPGGVDGYGVNEEAARAMSDSYFANACFASWDGVGIAGSFAEINTNAVAESFRRMSKMVRIQGRNVIRGYSVEGGKSVLWLSRTPMGSSGVGDRDWMDGLAPSKDAIATDGLRPGVRYAVRRGSILYAGRIYPAGSVFTGQWEQPEWTPRSADALVKEAEGIYPSAPPAGHSNEWVMLWQWKQYHPGSTSIYRPETFGDHFAFAERAHFMPPTFPQPPVQLQRHFVPGQSYFSGISDSKLWIAPEAPSGYRYVIGTNRLGCDEGDGDCAAAKVKFFTSCPVYEAPYEVESTSLVEEGGEELVKVVFRTRFRSHPDAPAGLGRSPHAWDLAALAAEDYRTDDNAIRQYVAWNQLGAMPNLKIGDSSITGFGGVAADGFLGSILPHMLWVKLVPKPYSAGASVLDAAATPLDVDPLIHAEVAIRVGCEGFVDGRTSAEYGCAIGIDSIYDYTFENLCFEAFGGRQIGIMPSRGTPANLPGEVRMDGLGGFGPLPTIPTSAEIYNQLAACVNLLASVRVVLPMTFQTRTLSGTADKVVTDARLGDGSPSECTSFSGGATGAGTIWLGTPSDAGASEASDWAESAFAISSVGAGFRIGTFAGEPAWSCDDVNWVVQTGRVDTDYRWELADGAGAALQGPWAGLFSDGSSRMLAVVEETTGTSGLRTVDSVEDGMYCGSFGGRWMTVDGRYLGSTSVGQTTQRCQMLPSAGRVHAPALGSQAIAGAYRTGIDNQPCPAGGSSNGRSISPVITDAVALTVPVV